MCCKVAWLPTSAHFAGEAAIQFLDTPDSTAVLVGIIRRFPDRSFLVDKVCALINSLFRVDSTSAASSSCHVVAACV